MRARDLAFFRHLASVLLVLAALFAASAAQAQGQTRTNNISAQLVAAGPAEPGEVLDLAILFRPQPRWHGYWSNPGDAGVGLQLDWNLPAGWQAGEPLYPVPQRLVIAGLMNHVYEGEHAVLVPVRVPDGAQVAPGTEISVHAEWLACTDEICVPEQDTLSLRLPGASDPATDARFNSWRAALPPLIDRSGTFEIAGDSLRIGIPLPASLDLSDPHVFVEQDRIAAQQRVAYAEPQTFRRNGDLLVAEVPLAELFAAPASGFDPLEEVSGIFAFGGEGQGVRFEAERGDVPSGGKLLASGAGAVETPLLVLIAGALLGGLLLNLMPCVFPILSLKALTLARAGESEAQARREALAYSAGVVLACLALGGLLLVLRAGGEQVGWAFQLQEPGVVLALSVLAVAITANLAGLYELPSLPITRAGGRSSAFATGLLAAFVATPCTGPFMAAALGAALLLPWEQALLLFATLGLGLALPFLLLGYVPALRSRLPRPGPWMDRFRKVLAVPMGLTALALLWLCWRLGGPTFALAGLVFALLLVTLLRGTARRRQAGKPVFGGLVVGSLAVLLAIAVATPSSFAPPAQSAESMLDPVDFSQSALAQAREEGRPVFLWFTADWCLTCKVNENLAIEREATREAFAEAGVVAMRGDWTRRDAEITQFLTEQGSAGVPLYLWYPADGGEPQQLPQVLTPDTLLELARSAG
jgi:DsbC/DsbD-like thiol-disulfide interchange protein/cytochrome c biogenesis protein CcdA